MDNTNPQGDQIATNVGDNAHNVAIGKEITQTNTTVTSSGDHSVAIGGSVSASMIVTGDNNQVYVNGRKTGPPLHYPPRAEHFVGREAELEKLLADLHPGRVVTLCGPGGIGKTALAAEAIARLTPDLTKPPERFPDGVFFHSFYNQKEAALALEQIARSFGEDPRPTPALAAQRALAGKHALLVLDGAEDADDLPTVLAARGNCGVLVTSRKRSDAASGCQDVMSLPDNEAVKLLQAWTGKRTIEKATAYQICALIGELPLAVQLAGHFMASNDINANEYLAWLQETPLAALEHGQRQHKSLPLLMEHSLTCVSEAARQALAVVGKLALAPFSADVTAIALATNSLQTRLLLGELVNYGLLLRQADGLYAVRHALIHTYSSERLVTSQSVIIRLATYYTAFVKQYVALHPPSLIQLDPARPHILAVLEASVEYKAWAKVNELAEIIDKYLDLRGFWVERIVTSMAGLRAARALKNRRSERNFLGNVGNTYHGLGQEAKAIVHYQTVIRMSNEMGDHQSKGGYLGNLGNAYHRLGQIDKAIKSYESALAISRKIGDRRSESGSLSNLGLIYDSLGQREKAINYYLVALDIARETRDSRIGGLVLGNLGMIYQGLGQIERAIECYQAALEIASTVGERHSESTQHGNLGRAYLDLRQLEKAIKHFQVTLSISREIGSRHEESAALSNLGLVYSALGQSEKAIEHYQTALEISREISDRQGECFTLSFLGAEYYIGRQLEHAIRCYQIALAISREIGNRHIEGDILRKWGAIYKELNDLPEARRLWEKALVIYDAIKSREATQMRSELEALEQLGRSDTPSVFDKDENFM